MKKYTITLTDDGESISCESVNDGFATLELIGLLEWKLHDIYEQLSGHTKPDIIRRECIVDEQEAPDGSR
jgi:hypothetical protein